LYRSDPGIREQKGLDVLVRPDVLSPATISEMVQGSDAVLSAIGLRRKHPINPFSKVVSPSDLTSGFATRLVEAMLEPNAPRKVIAISAGGIGDSWNAVALPLRGLFRYSNIGIAYKDLNLMEEVYSASSLDWMCVRPATLNNRHLSKRVRETSRYRLSSQVSRSDVAWYVLQCLEGAICPSSRTPMICN
jgi:hypothetical protein